MIAAAVAGLVAGSLHVVAGPDHLGAVAPWAFGARRRAWRVGALWGGGHTVAVFVLAALAWSAREFVPLERLSGWGEAIVGWVLIVIGLLALRRTFRTRLHVHAHEHDGVRHAHFHVHGAPHRGSRGHERADAHAHSHAPAWVGALHGVAGSSHFVGVFPALALPGRAEAAAYLAGYGAGTLAAMTLFAVALGGVAERLAPGATGRAYRVVLGACGCLAIGIGGIWIVS